MLVGIVMATTLAAAGPLYMRALERLGLNIAIDGLVRPFSNISPFARFVPLIDSELDRTQRAMTDAIDRHLSHIYDGHETFLRVETWFAGLPRDPLPDQDTTGEASRAYFRYYSNLEDHVTFTSGRMGTDTIRPGRQGPLLEAVISEETAREFELTVEDEVIVAPSLGSAIKLTARVVGVMAAFDPIEDYWHFDPSIFIDPPPPEEPAPEGSQLLYDPERPPVPLFITERAMVDGVGRAYPGTLIDSIWFIYTDTEGLKDWSVSEALGRFEAFQHEVTTAMPGAQVSSGIVKMLVTFDQRRFFSRAPLLLMMTVLVVTVLFFLAMIVSILVKRREEDTSLLRTRGAGVLRLSRLYLLEGLVMTVIAVAAAPFLATGLVALAGLLPQFADVTEPGLLPVEMDSTPFLVAAAAGFLCLMIYVIPGVLGTRGGLLVHKLRSSRPPTVPILHRYFIDVAILGVGGLAFWEMHSRGHIISGGLFKEVEVNEALLFAPILFLLAVALVFMRLFPLLVRFISGESPALLHLLATASILTLAPALAVREAGQEWGLASFGPAALLVAVGAVYWATTRVRSRRQVAGFVVQAVLIGGFLSTGPDIDHAALRIAFVALVSLVPAQALFLLIRVTAGSIPVWLSMGLRHMARNPLQYTWLVLLLVLVTGAGVLATTVGETLERSRSDRINYDVATDVRIVRLPRYLVLGAADLSEKESAFPGITLASLAMRRTAKAGPFQLELLAVKSVEFAHVSWYRDDFSQAPLTDVMAALRRHELVEKLPVPDQATNLGVWVKPKERYINLSLYLVVANDTGASSAVFMGQLGPPEWQLMTGEVRSQLDPPLHVVAVQIYEPGFGPVATPGAIYLDAIHVPTDGGEEIVIEDFEGQMRWTPILTSPVSSDRLELTTSDKHEGKRAAEFSFGKDNQRGIRGFYQSPTAGPLPVVISSSLADVTGVGAGDSLFVDIGDNRLETVVQDVVRYFPTLSPKDGRFIVADLDRLLAHLSILRPFTPFRPNELFITADPTADETYQLGMSALSRVSGQVLDRSAQLRLVARDPLTTAGWRSMSLVSLGIVVLAAGLGYVTYLTAFAGRSRTEMGFLRSMGLSRRQLMGLLGFEHISIAVIGLALGTWAGFQMSRLMVSSLSIDETGDSVVPPFILTTDWGPLLATYAALIAIFVGAVLLLNRSVHRHQLHTIARVESM